MADTPGREDLSIADFAKLSRTNRSTLLYYDKIGLLSPVSRKENSYRYYSYSQIPAVNQIRTCQALGMSLEEIKELRVKDSPEFIDNLFDRLIDQIDGEINTWINSRKLLITLQSIVRPLLTVVAQIKADLQK